MTLLEILSLFVGQNNNNYLYTTIGLIIFEMLIKHAIEVASLII